MFRKNKSDVIVSLIYVVTTSRKTKIIVNTMEFDCSESCTRIFEVTLFVKNPTHCIAVSRVMNSKSKLSKVEFKGKLNSHIYEESRLSLSAFDKRC